MIIYMCRNPGGNLCYFASTSRDEVERWISENGAIFVGEEEDDRWFNPQSERVYYLDEFDTEIHMMDIYYLIYGMKLRNK